VKWLLIVTVLASTGCAEVRHLTMTKDELRLYGKMEITPCLDPTVVCIHP
jgi:hypothetical protein